MDARAPKGGPDELDLAAYLDDLSERAEEKPCITIQATRGNGGQLQLYVSVKPLVAPQLVKERMGRLVWGCWPDKRHLTFMGMLYRLLYEYDRRIVSEPPPRAKR